MLGDIVTNAPTVTTETLHRVIECKCQKNLGTTEIRGEFGKAYDMRATSYLLWSYYRVADRIIAGAKQLGLTLEVLDLSAICSTVFQNEPEQLLRFVAQKVESARIESAMGKLLVTSGQQVIEKMRTSANR